MVPPRTIQKLKNLEIAYKSVIDEFVCRQDDLLALEAEEEY